MIRMLLLACLALPVIADPLFESDEPLELTLESRFKAINQEKDKSKSWEGVLTHGGQSFEVDIRLRGNSRLLRKNCRHPPLKLDFKKSQIKGTLFEGQADIKLVVQCHNRSSYADYLRAEFLIYKAFNLLTPLSYRVRWANMRYVDAGQVREHPAFFIERKKRLAKRNDLKPSDVSRTRANHLLPEQAALIALFQYVIGNPDYSLIYSAEEECCHNAKLLEGADDGLYRPIIYDFDGTGIIDAPYAGPPSGLPISKVTDRIFLGFCRFNDNLPTAKQILLDKEDAIRELFAKDSLLGSYARDRAGRFLADSYKTLKKDRSYQRQIIRACREARPT